MKNESEMKLCQDCRHFRDTACGHCGRFDDLQPRDPVNGGPAVMQWRDCRSDRRARWFSLFDRCGPEAKFFEPKTRPGERPAPP